MSELLYRVDWKKLKTYEVIKRTKATLVVKDVSPHGYSRHITGDKIGQYRPTAAEAWLAEVANLEHQIAATKDDLQDLRTQLGMAQSEMTRASK